MNNPRPRVENPTHQKDRNYTSRLSPQERARITELLTDPKNTNMSVAQIMYKQEADGEYLCSLRTAYRIADTIGREPVAVKRRAVVRKPSAAPQLCATKPGQVLVWDVTWVKSKFYKRRWPVYVVTDLYSRRIVGVAVHTTENSAAACKLIEDTIARVTEMFGTKPEVIHSDNGAIMVSEAMKELLARLGVSQSTNRPGVSNVG